MMKGKEYKDILTKDQCKIISDSIMKLKNEDKLFLETDVRYYKNSLGIFNLPETLDLLPEIETVIKQDNPDITFENSYARIYRNGSTLSIHTDRPDLYLTLSVCVYTNLDESWPLLVSNVSYDSTDPWNPELPADIYLSDFTMHYTPVGSGATCFGVKYPHWREPLTCNDDQQVIQLFYHWNKV